MIWRKIYEYNKTQTSKLVLKIWEEVYMHNVKELLGEYEKRFWAFFQIEVYWIQLDNKGKLCVMMTEVSNSWHDQMKCINVNRDISVFLM